MKRLSLVLLLISSFSAFADTAVGPMNYQGRLLDNAGIPVTGAFDFVARIYDAASGGTLKYQENHNNVSVDDGVYSFLVGTQAKSGGDSTWSVELWNCCSTLYLEVAVGGETLSPRQRLAAAPFAFQANLALTTNNALALGGKPSDWFDSTLEAICISGKGKWLELANGGAGACLGVGSSFPGGPSSYVGWNTLTADNNFSNLDLSRADISGISFNGANLSGTVFKETTYQVIGFSGSNLSNTVWDGAIATGDPAVLANWTIITGATFKNMDMSNWNLSQLPYYRYEKMSAAYLSGCPAGLMSDPFQWECRDMQNGSGLYILIGPYGDYSSNSAAAIETLGGKTLDLGRTVFNNSPNLYNSTFKGVRLTQDFKETTLQNVNMDYTTFIGAKFSSTWFAGVTFRNATLHQTTFQTDIAYFTDLDFSGAKLSYVDFQKDANIFNFTGASLHQVDFGSLKSANFTSATLDDVRINTKLEGNYPNITTFNGTRIMGDFYVADLVNDYGYHYLIKDVEFIGTHWSGDFSFATFTGNTLFKEVAVYNLDLCNTNIPLIDGSAPHDDLGRIRWTGPAECPDGTDVSGGTGAGTCNYSARMVASYNNCTAGLP